ncbi:SLC13 family permease [Sporomusa sp.]|uniref:SLC13 family permease n=1 Tax=Sporomusa sp. TaxID=2078658 RepID=UPI002CD8BE64|nr:SLC13 family permease [Sporomusa sp.]HWR44973.1 SLC13 family permease [Sporomusa sp.]
MKYQIEMLWAALILVAVLVIFTLGKSPIFRVDRAGAAIIGAVATVGTGVLSFQEATSAVDYRTIIILFSMMIVVANLKLAGFFELMGNAVCQRVNSKKQLLFAIVMVSGIMSALAINDIICLLFTPVVLFICRKAQCNPLPHLLGVAMASNIGSAATLLGNPQNILVGSLSNISFISYFLTASPVALIGLISTYAVITYYYREELKGRYFASPINNTNVHIYLIIKTFLVLIFVLIAYMSGYDLALSASLGGALLLITRRVKPNKVYTSVDFNLLIIFIGLFIIVAGVEHSGLMNLLLEHLFFSEINSIGLFAVLTLIVSNIVSNVPAVLLLKFLIPATNAEYWWKALALFSTLAGNLTITGSIANLIVVEIAKGEHVHITARDYFKVGFPLTLLTTAIGVLLL